MPRHTYEVTRIQKSGCDVRYEICSTPIGYRGYINCMQATKFDTTVARAREAIDKMISRLNAPVKRR